MRKIILVIIIVTLKSFAALGQYEPMFEYLGVYSSCFIDGYDRGPNGEPVIKYYSFDSRIPYRIKKGNTISNIPKTFNLIHFYNNNGSNDDIDLGEGSLICQILGTSRLYFYKGILTCNLVSPFINVEPEGAINSYWVKASFKVLKPIAPEISDANSNVFRNYSSTHGDTLDYTICDCNCNTTFTTGYYDTGMEYDWNIYVGTDLKKTIHTTINKLQINLNDFLKENNLNSPEQIAVNFTPRSPAYPDITFDMSGITFIQFKPQSKFNQLPSGRNVDVYPVFGNNGIQTNWICAFQMPNCSTIEVQEKDEVSIAAYKGQERLNLLPEQTQLNDYILWKLPIQDLNNPTNEPKTVSLKAQVVKGNISETEKSCYAAQSIVIPATASMTFNVIEENNVKVKESGVVGIENVYLCGSQNSFKVTASRGLNLSLKRNGVVVDNGFKDLRYGFSNDCILTYTIDDISKLGGYDLEYIDFAGNVHTKKITVVGVSNPNTTFTAINRTCNNPINGRINLPSNNDWSSAITVTKGSSQINLEKYNSLEKGDYDIAYKYEHTQSGCWVEGSRRVTVNEEQFPIIPIIVPSLLSNTCKGKNNGVIKLPDISTKNWKYQGVNYFKIENSDEKPSSYNGLNEGVYNIKYEITETTKGCIYKGELPDLTIINSYLINDNSITPKDELYYNSCIGGVKNVTIHIPASNQLNLKLTEGNNTINGNNGTYNLKAGSYTATLAYNEANLCPDTEPKSIEIKDPAAIIVTQGNTIYNCEKNNAIVNFSVSENNFQVRISKKDAKGSYGKLEELNGTSNIYSKELSPGDYQIDFFKNDCSYIDYSTEFTIYSKVTLSDYSDKTISTVNCEEKPIVLTPNFSSGDYFIEKKVENGYSRLSTNQPVGAYIVRVKDNITGCVTNDVKVTVGASSTPKLSIVSTSVSPSCYKGDVQVTLTKSGGDNTQLSTAQGYNITNIIGSNKYNIAIAGQSTYPSTIRIIANDLTTGCSVGEDVTVTNLTSGLSLDEKHTRAICLNNDGTITLTASGGSGSNYTYKCVKLDKGEEMRSVSENSTKFERLDPATYKCTVTNNSVCDASKNITIKSLFDDLKTSDLKVQDVSCFGASNGIIDISLSNVDESMMLKDILLKKNNSTVDTKPYVNNTSTFRFSGLSAGVYTYSITSSLSETCSKDVLANIPITQPSPLAFSGVVTTPRVVDYKNNITGGTIAFKVENATGQIIVDEVGIPFVKNGESKITLNKSTYEGNIENLDEGSYTLSASYKCSNTINVSTSKSIFTIQPAFSKSIIQPANNRDNKGIYTLANGSKYSDTGLHYDIIIYSGQNIVEEFKGIELNFDSKSIELPSIEGGYKIKISIPEKGNLVVWNETFNINPPLIVDVNPVNSVRKLCFGITLSIADVKPLLKVNDGAGTFSIVAYKENSSSSWISVDENTRLSKGIYRFRIIDVDSKTVAETANNLSIETREKDIEILFSTPSPHTVKCNKDEDLITGTISGGWEHYNNATIGNTDLAISSSQFSFKKGVGNYEIKLKDAEGCPYSTTYNITQPELLTLNIDNNQSALTAGCQQSDKGTVVLSAEKGNGEFTYFYQKPNEVTKYSNNPNSASFTLEPNTGGQHYTFIVVDKEGCTASIQQSITTKYINVSNNLDNTKSDVLCNGGASGKISLSTPILEDKFFYSLEAKTLGDPIYVPYSASYSSGVFSGLKINTYRVKLQTKNLCEVFSQDIKVEEPSQLDLSVVARNACLGEKNGRVEIGAKGGIPPYEITYGNNVIETNSIHYANTIGGFGNGDHFDVILKDKNGCSDMKPFTISEVQPISYTATVVDHACLGTNGQVHIAAEGTSNVSWKFYYNLFGTWVSDDVKQPFDFTKSKLPAGVYRADAFDNNSSCLVASIPDNSVVVHSGVKISIINQKDVVKCASNTSKIGVVLNALSNGGGDQLSYSYRIKGTVNNFIPIPDINSAVFGKNDYELKVETKYCSDIKDFTITGPGEALTITTTPTVIADGYHLKCNGGNDASVTLLGSGGWNSSYQYAVYNEDPKKLQWTSSNQLGGLAKGDYKFCIKDAEGCTVTSSEVAIVEPQALKTDIVSISENLAGGSQTSSVRVKVSSGLAPYHISIASNPSIEKNAVLENSEQLLDITGIGAKSIVVTDRLGCVRTDNFNLDGVSNIFKGTITNNTCKDDNTGRIAVALLDGSKAYSTVVSRDGSSYTSNASNEFVNLIAGTYSITVSSNNHFYTQQYEVKQPVKSLKLTAIPVSIKTVNSADYHLTCFGGNDGKVVLAAADGWGNYEYCIDNGKGSWTANSKVDGLLAGSYRFTVKDGQGCTLTSEPVTLTQANAFPAFEVLAKEQTTTNGSVSNLLSLKPTGGVPTYSLELKGVEPTPRTLVASGDRVDFKFNNIGEFSAVLTDQLGCQHAETFAYEGVYKKIVFDKTVTDVTCAGKSTGSIAIGNPQGSYTYKLTKDGVSYTMTSMAFERLGKGWYDLEVTDGEYTYKAALEVKELGKTITLDAAPAVVATIEGTAYHIACSGDNSGKVSLAASNGYSTYSYHIVGQSSEWSNSPSFANLLAGNYQFEVKDANGCSATTSLIELKQLTTKPDIEVVGKSQKYLYGSNQQNLSVKVTGGKPLYTFALEGVDAQRTNVAENTSVSYDFTSKGTFSLRVTDQLGCVVTKALDFEGADKKIVFEKSINPVSCFGGNDGKITLTNLKDRYSINLSKDGKAVSGGDFVYSNLSKGVYDLEASIGEYLYKEKIDLSEPLKLSFNANADPSCHNAVTGKVTVTDIVNNAGNSYSYSVIKDGSPMASKVSNLAEAISFPNLTEGSYKVVATNTKDYCKDSDTYTVEGLAIQKLEPLTYSLDAQHPCNSVQAQVKGNFAIGSRAFDLDLEQLGAVGNEWVKVNSVKVSGNVSSVALPVTPGQYRFRTTDSNWGCADITNTITVYTNPQITKAEVKDEVCYGTKGLLAAAATGGSGNLSLYVGLKDYFTIFKDAVYLAPESYKLKVVDDKTGCTLLREGDLVIHGPVQKFAFSFNPSLYGSYNIDCNGNATGSVAVSLAGGGTLQGAAYGDKTFTSRSFNINQLATGWHRLTATDSFGCTIKDSVELKEPSKLAISIDESSQHLECSSANIGFVRLSAAGGSSGYQFAMNQSAFGVGSSYGNLAVGDYTFRVKDSNGCTDEVKTVIDTRYLPFDIHLDAKNVSCFGAKDGKITAVNDGSQTYTYSWHNSAITASSVEKLQPGTYGVTIATAAGCTKDLFAQITEPQLLSFTTTAKSACPGEVNGLVNFEANGGTKPYAFLLNDQPFGAIGKDLSAAYGLYLAKVVDANGCTAMQTLNIDKKEGSISANFLVATTSASSDTLVLVDISNPKADYIRWDLSNDGNPIRRINGENDQAPQVKFDREGDYRINMTAYYGDCEYTISKVISVKNGVVSDGAKTFVLGANGIKDFEVYPNPSRGQSKFRIRLFQPYAAVLQVFDMGGHLVSTQDIPQGTENEGVVAFNTKTSGAFIVRVMLKNKKDYREVKVIVQ